MDRRQFLAGLGGAAVALALPAAAIAAPLPLAPLATTSELFGIVPSGQQAILLTNCNLPSIAGDLPQFGFEVNRSSPPINGTPTGSIEEAERSFVQSCPIYDHTLDLSHKSSLPHLVRCSNRVATSTRRGRGNKILVHPDDAERMLRLLEMATKGGPQWKVAVANHGVMEPGQGLAFYSRTVENDDFVMNDGPGAIQDGHLSLNTNASDYGIRFNFV